MAGRSVPDMTEYEKSYRGARDAWLAADAALRELVAFRPAIWPDDEEELNAAHKAATDAWDAWAAVRAEASVT